MLIDPSNVALHEKKRGGNDIHWLTHVNLRGAPKRTSILKNAPARVSTQTWDQRSYRIPFSAKCKKVSIKYPITSPPYTWIGRGRKGEEAHTGHTSTKKMFRSRVGVAFTMLMG